MVVVLVVVGLGVVVVTVDRVVGLVIGLVAVVDVVITVIKTTADYVITNPVLCLVGCE